MEPKWSQNGSQIRPNTYRGRSQSVPKKVTKIDPENRAKREPKMSPKIRKNHEKRVSKNEVHHRRAPGAPQGRYWRHFGSHFNDFLMYFGVFPCVFNVFHVKINVFPRVYADLTLRFLVFLGMAILLFFKVFQASLGDWPAKKRARERASEQARARERERESRRESERVRKRGRERERGGPAAMLPASLPSEKVSDFVS